MAKGVGEEEESDEYGDAIRGRSILFLHLYVLQSTSTIRPKRLKTPGTLPEKTQPAPQNPSISHLGNKPASILQDKETPEQNRYPRNVPAKDRRLSMWRLLGVERPQRKKGRKKERISYFVVGARGEDVFKEFDQLF